MATTVEISAGCFVPAEYAEQVRAERRAEEALDAMRAWLRNPANRANENYSDIYKEVYGYRPWSDDGRRVWL